MRFKKDKEEVLREIQARASGCISYELQNINMQVNMGSVAYSFQNAIAKAVAEGFRVMIENQYTDDDFERDLTLKP